MRRALFFGGILFSILIASLAVTPLSVQRFHAMQHYGLLANLIGREGAIVAVRDAQGRLAAHAERPSSFELKRWLERDGDQRDPKDLRKSTMFRCDPTGCVTEASGAMIAVSRHPASLADDCARAKILIITGERPATCTAPQQIYDRKSLRQTGTVALTRQPDGSYRSHTVAGARGLRP